MDLTLGLYLYKSQDSQQVPFPEGASQQIFLSDYKYSATRMGAAPSISGTIKYPAQIDDQWSSYVYVEFRGEKYFLKRTPYSSYDNTSTMYTYQLEFASERAILEQVYFIDAINQIGGVNIQDTVSDNTDFSFSGDINVFASKLNASMVRSGISTSNNNGEIIQGYRAIVDDGVTSESKFMQVSGKYISDVLKDSYELYEIPHYFKGNEIHFGYFENFIGEDTPLEYGHEGALLSVSKNNSTKQIITRITGYGSDRNIPYYYPNPTPKGFVKAVTNNNKYSVTDILQFARTFNIDETAEYVGLFGTIKTSKYRVKTGNFWSNWIEYDDQIDDVKKDQIFQIDFEITPQSIGEFMMVVNTGLAPSEFSIESAYIYYGQNTVNSQAITVVGLDAVSATFTKDTTVNIVVEIKFNVESVNVGISGEGEKYWKLGNQAVKYKLKDFGIKLNSGQSETQGDTIKMVESESRINVQKKLVPSTYRETKGTNRWYDAKDGTYKDETGKDIEFENVYTPRDVKEYILTDDTIYPTISGLKNATSKRIDKFIGIAFDENDNNEIYPDGDKYANQYVHPYFFVKLNRTNGRNGFNLFDGAIDGEQMSISFTSGLVASCNFNIAVDASGYNTVQVDASGNLMRDRDGNVLCNRPGQQSFPPQDGQQNTKNNEVWIALEKDSSTMSAMMPDKQNNIIPSTDDTFVILGISLPDEYFIQAEKRLEEKLIKYMRENNGEKFNFSLKFSSIYLTNNEEIYNSLNENSYIRINYMGVDYKLFVDSYSATIKSDSILPEITVTLTDNITFAETKKQLIYKLTELASSSINSAKDANKIAKQITTKTEQIDAKIETLGTVKGEKGDKGDPGAQGEKGDSGNYTEARYTKATSRSRKPTVDDPSKREPTSINDYFDTYEWTLEIPKVTDGEYLWKIEAIINGSDNTLIQNWSDPIRVTPINGDYIKYMYAVSTDANTMPDFDSGGTYPGSNWTEYFGNLANEGGYIWQTSMKINGNTGKPGWTYWQTPIRITPTNGLNGVSVSKVKVEYAVSDSSSNAPTSGWSETTPTWQNDKFIWSRTKPVFSDSSSGEQSAPVCLTGSKGATGSDGISISWQGERASNPSSPEEGWAYYDKTAKKSFIYRNGTWNVMTQDGAPGASGDPGVSITKVDVEYAISNSNTTAPTGNVWDTEAPDWVDGEYIWSRTKTTYSIGSPTCSEAVCITGGKGATGSNGRGIDSIVEEYYSSTSATELVGGTWSETFPGWEDRRYIWTRSIITYTDGKTETTDPICVTGGKGETGDKGSRGPALRGPQDWNDIAVGYQFYSGADGEPFIDVVLYDGNHYLCKTSHTKGTNSAFEPSTSSTYWTKSEKFDIIATKLLLSDYALIKNLGAEFIEMKDDSGNVVFLAENGKVECNIGTFNNITVGSGTIGGWNITKDGLINRDGNPLLSPNIRCVSKDNDAEASIGANARWESPRVVGYFKNNINQENKAIAVKILANSTATKNVAIDISGGCIQGLAMSNEVVEEASKELGKDCNHFIFTAAGEKKITLPILSYSDDGHIVRITCTKSGYIDIKTQASIVDENNTFCTQAIIVSCIAGVTSINEKGEVNDIQGPATMEFVWVRDYPRDSNQKGAWVLCMYSGKQYLY